MTLPFGIQQSTLAGGLTGIATFAIGLGLTALGITNGATLAAGLATILVPIVVHFVPDAAKVDIDLKNLAKELPQIYPAYPSDPTSSTNISNINKG